MVIPERIRITPKTIPVAIIGITGSKKAIAPTMIFKTGLIINFLSLLVFNKNNKVVIHEIKRQIPSKIGITLIAAF